MVTNGRQSQLAARVVIAVASVLCLGPWCVDRTAGAEEPASVLRGRVMDADGTPLGGLAVQFAGQNDETCAEGLFSLESVPAGTGMMQVAGERGIGRVPVHVDVETEPVEVVYPVVTHIVILHDNDTHFNFRYPKAFAQKVDRIRDEYPNVWLFSAGDVFSCAPRRWREDGWPDDEEMAYARRSRNMIDAMNRVGYDAMTLGNHELVPVGKHTRAALDRAKFALLGANIEIETDRLPPLEPYFVFETDNGYTLAVLGLSVSDRSTSRERTGVDSRNPVETAKEYRRLAGEHDVVVALTHIGVELDRQLAGATDFIDVIVGGHSHTLLSKADRVDGTLIAQAGAGGRYLGVITLTLVNGTLVASEGQVRTIRGHTGDD